MNFKGIVIVSVLLLAVFTLGSVSAVSDDVVDSDVLADSGDMGEVIDSPNENLIADSDGGLADDSEKDLIGESQKDLLNSPVDDSELNSVDDGNLDVSSSDLIAEEEKSSENLEITELDEGNGNIVGDSVSFDDIFPEISYPNGTVYIWARNNSYWSDSDITADCFITLSHDSKLNGNLTVFLNGVKLDTYGFPKEGDPNYINIELEFSQLGKNNVTLIFENGTVTLKKTIWINVDYMVSVYNKTIGSSERKLFFQLPYDFKGTIEVLIDNVKCKVYRGFNFHSYCWANYTIMPSNLKIGNHKLTVYCSGDGFYPDRKFEHTFKVVPSIEFGTVTDKNNRVYDQVYLNLPKNAKGTLIVKLYNSKNKLVKTFSKKVSNGKAIIAFTKLYGNFKKVIATYNGKDYPCKAQWDDVYIRPAVSIFKSFYQGEKKSVSINLPGKKGTLKVHIINYNNLKEKVYSARLVKGKASVAIKNLAVGRYWFYVDFMDSTSGKTKKYSIYLDDDLSNFNVYKPVKLTSSKSAIYYGNGKYKVKLTNSAGKALAGKYVSFKINGKYVSKVKTNKKGWAVFKIPAKYVPKKYKFTVTALGKTINRKVTVRQVLSLKSVNVKKSANSLVLRATLKKGKTALKGKKLTFKFNGKTYSAKTNKKGIAKVIIKKSVLKNLKVGKKVKYQVAYSKDAVKRTAKVRR